MLICEFANLLILNTGRSEEAVCHCGLDPQSPYYLDLNLSLRKKENKKSSINKGFKLKIGLRRKDKAS